MKINKILTTFLCCVVLLCQTARAQDQKPAEDPRVARLVGLAKVWGTVKYFHPFLAYRDIDWDKALIETIPKVNAAKTAQEYEAAINQMLAVLPRNSERIFTADENLRLNILSRITDSDKPTTS